MNNEINLIPGKTKHTASLLKKRATLHVIAIGTMFVISFLSVVLFMLIALSPLPSLRQREKDETKRLSFFNEMIVKIQLTKDRLTQTKKILQSRPVYSTSINIIKNLLPGNAVIEEVHLNEKILSITITSTSLASLDLFIEDLKLKNTDSKLFRKLTLVSLQRDFEKGQYILTLEVI